MCCQELPNNLPLPLDIELHPPDKAIKGWFRRSAAANEIHHEPLLTPPGERV